MVTRRQVSEWYNKKHKHEGNSAWRPIKAYSVFLDYIGATKGKTLLDVGCGVGSLLKLADQKGLKTYGVDISSQGIKLTKKNSPNSKVRVGRGENLPYKSNTFDYVVCLGVLEHFLDIEKGLKEFNRVGKKNAKYCIMVPNSNFLYWLIIGKKGTKQQDINENLFTKDECLKKFKNSGFKIDDIYQDTWHRDKINIFADINPIKIIKRIVIKGVWSLLPLQLTYQFVFVLEKSNGKK